MWDHGASPFLSLSLGRVRSEYRWRQRYLTLRRGCQARQMLGYQLLGFGQAPQFNFLIAADGLGSIHNHHRQGMIAVVEVRQHLSDGLAIPGDQLALRPAHFGITKEVPAATT